MYTHTHTPLTKLCSYTHTEKAQSKVGLPWLAGSEADGPVKQASLALVLLPLGTIRTWTLSCLYSTGKSLKLFSLL